MAARLLIALVSALALVGGGYWWGATATDNAWTARQAQDAKKAQDALDKETERADLAAANYLREHLDQEDRYAALDAVYNDLRRRAPLVAVRPAVAHAAASAESAGASGACADLLDHDPALTLAAVRMWNGALAGVDAPAGACGPAGATEGADAVAAEACAEGSGLTLDDAWANHAANAKSCADDRQRYRQLIDFLNGK